MLRFIVQEIHRQDRISFARFVDQALHVPDLDYYTSEIPYDRPGFCCGQRMANAGGGGWAENPDSQARRLRGVQVFNICPRCGEYRPDKTIDPSGPFAVCPVCGYGHLFRQMPLLLVGGACATGKSTVLLALAGHLGSTVLLDSDLLWGPQFDQPQEKFRGFFELWLRMAKNIGQSGRPVALFGGGFAVPANIEPCIERRYFSAVHYLALVCQDDVLVARMRARSGLRQIGDKAFIARQLEFNNWLMANGQSVRPSITLVDTTSRLISETADKVSAWITEYAGVG